MSDKIKPQHLERKAILYIRQSSVYQVNHNLESQKLQYAMEERLRQLGWREIEVVDDDLGRSAAGTVTRAGFERMVAEVCLGKVGAVAAREVSRFARNSRDWQQLIEVCRVVDTVLIDQETVYTPRQSNDRLLLGLKGSLNEYELDLLRQRSVEARRAKAQRGELIVAAPVGYIKTEELALTPDRSHQPFAIGIGFRRLHRRAQHPQTECLQVVDLGRENRVTVVEEEAVRVMASPEKAALSTILGENQSAVRTMAEQETSASSRLSKGCVPRNVLSGASQADFLVFFGGHGATPLHHSEFLVRSLWMLKFACC